MNALFQQTLMGFLPGNFYRIRGALKYGARKLGWILLLPRERIGNELKMFFSNTLDRHGSNCWTDIQNPSLASGTIGSDFSSLSLQPMVCSNPLLVSMITRYQVLKSILELDQKDTHRKWFPLSHCHN